MKTRSMVCVLVASLLFVLVTASAQKAEKKWTEWTKKDAQKILDDSPWGQTQIDTDTSQMMFSPTNDPRQRGVGSTSTDDSRAAQGATNQSVDVKFHVRLFSARPIRQALARQMELQQKLPDEALARLHSFAEVKSENSIIVTVSFESTDQRYGNSVMQALNSATTGTLKNTCYLQRNDGKQLFIEEYVPPGKDGFGARFIFLRYPDEKLFITPESGEIHFFVQLSSGLKIDRRFKVASMMYQGELEY